MRLTPLLLASLVSAAPASLHERQAACNAGVQIICARGTFEAQGFGLQQTVVNAILAKIPNSNASAVIYPASAIDIPGSLQAGVSNTQQQIFQYYQACPNSKIVLMGYSQGAQVIGDAISGGGTTEPDGVNAVSNPTTPIPQSIGKNVVAVVLFGDINRVKGQGMDNEPDSCTVSSGAPRPAANQAAMAFYADRLDEYCAAGDPVCCSTGENILDHLSYFGPNNTDAIANYVADKYNAC